MGGLPRRRHGRGDIGFDRAALPLEDRRARGREGDTGVARAPLRVLRAAAFKDLVGGGQPEDPQREAAMLRDVVQATVAELRSGKGVVVHCAGGTGRTGTVIACALAALGMAQDEVLNYMASVNTARGKSPAGRSLSGRSAELPTSW